MEPISISTLLGQLFKIETIEFLLIVILFGMLGGLARKFASGQDGSGKSPWMSSVVVGGAAAIAILFIFIPNDPIRLVSMCLIAGYGGKAILDSVQSKLDIAKLVEEKAQIEKSVSTAIDNFNDKILPTISNRSSALEISGKNGGLQDLSNEIMKFSGILNSLEVRTKARSEK
jgi:hypothetical protein